MYLNNFFCFYRPKVVWLKARNIIYRNLHTNVELGSENHFFYSERHLELQKPLKEFIKKKINPNVDDWEKKCAFPARSLFSELGQLGIFGANKQPEWGGLGLSFSFSFGLAEVLGEIECGAIPMACAVQSSMATPALAQFGTKSLKHEFLSPSIAGKRVACIGVSETCAGSDVAGIRTTARLDYKTGKDLIINGSKCWITNGQQADWICLLVNTIGNGFSNDKPHKNKSLLCVNLSESGITFGKSIEKLGMRCSDTAEIFFDDVRIPASNIIGQPGYGFKYQMQQFQEERLIGCALVLAPLEKVLQSTVKYAMNREMFGGRMFDCHQVVRYTLAELSSELQSLRALLYHAVVVKEKCDKFVVNNSVDNTIAERLANEVTILASMAKFKTGRLARRITDECLQIWGGNGYTWKSEVGRAFRDFRLYSIGGGCDEVMLSIIARNLQQQSQ